MSLYVCVCVCACGVWYVLECTYYIIFSFFVCVGLLCKINMQCMLVHAHNVLHTMATASESLTRMALSTGAPLRLSVTLP